MGLLAWCSRFVLFSSSCLHQEASLGHPGHAAMFMRTEMSHDSLYSVPTCSMFHLRQFGSGRIERLTGHISDTCDYCSNTL